MTPEQARTVVTPPSGVSALSEMADTKSDGTEVLPRRRRRRWGLLVGIPLGIALFLASAAGVAVWQIQRSVDQKINRFDSPFTNLPPEARPAPTSAMNLLVVGSDSRISAGDPRQWEAGAQRTDCIMVIHVPADRSGAYAVSIPRDSWVDIPGHGKAKINAAYSWGGPALTIRTVEQLTGLRMNHIVITDFDGFARITDLLGGVRITVPRTTHGSTGGQGDNFAAGTYRMDGRTALTYVRQRYNLPNGDFDRVKRQQNWMRAIMRTAVASGAQKDPQRLLDLLNTMASSLATDKEFTIDEMRDLVWSLRNVGPGGVQFVTAPVAGTGWSPDHKQAIVLLDSAANRSLWKAVRADQASSWMSEHADSVLGDSVS